MLIYNVYYNKCLYINICIAYCFGQLYMQCWVRSALFHVFEAKFVSLYTQEVSPRQNDYLAAEGQGGRQ